MIGTALQLELRILQRSPLRLSVLALMLAIGCLVVRQGQDDVARWEKAIETGREAEEKMLSEARGYFESGQHGPADRAWINLTQPRWQDYYAATRLARQPAPLAAIAFASPEAGAVTMRIDRWADPSLASGNEIENPALAVLGGLDLVTVLALLLPLLVLALGLEVGGYERVNGMMPLVRVQSGRDRSWILARCLAVGVISGSVGLVLVLVATIATGAPVLEALPLAVMVLAYTAVWTALLATVGLLARTPSQGAVALGGAWIVLCVLVPAIAVERAAAIAADDFAVDLTVEARDAGAALAELEDEQLQERLFERFPSLREKAPEAPSAGRRVALQGLRILGLEERLARRETRGARYAELVSRASWASPAVALTHALERLAGRGPEASNAYARAVIAAAADRMESYVAASWAGDPLGAADFERLVSATPGGVAPPRPAWWQQGLPLLAWLLGLLAIARILTRRPR